MTLSFRDYTASDGRMMNERRIGKDLERSGSGVIEVII
jgi:hypothetical protein